MLFLFYRIIKQITAFNRCCLTDYSSRKVILVSDPVLTTPEKLKTAFSLCKRIKYFPSKLQRRNLQTQQSPFSLDLCLRKKRSGKSRDYRDVIVPEKVRFKMFFSSTLKRQAGVFKFLQFEKSFRKAQFS